MIEDCCIENNLIDEVEEKPTAETAEVLKLKLEFEHEERRLAHEEAREEAQRACRSAEAEAQRAHAAAEAEAQKVREASQELRLAELKEARELRGLDLKAEKEKALLDAEIEAAACEHELKMASMGKHSPPDRASAFDPARNIRIVPPSKKRKLINILLILRKLLIV